MSVSRNFSDTLAPASRPLWTNKMEDEAMLNRLIQHRRRIYFATCSAMLCTTLVAGPGPMPAAAGILALLTGGLIVMFALPHRRWIESFGLAAPVAALLPLSEPLFASSLILFTALAHKFFAMQPGRFMPLLVTMSSQRSAKVAGNIQTLWPRLIPGASHPDDHWTGTLVDFDNDPDDHETIYLRYRNSDAMPEEVTVTILEHEPNKHCRYFIERDIGASTEASIMDITISEPEPGLCQIDSKLTYLPLPLRSALGRWFDDAFDDDWQSITSSVTEQNNWRLTGRAEAATSAPELAAA